jgi:hypothetical protein
MERLQNESLKDLEAHLWAEHTAQESAAARAATTIAFMVEEGVVTGGAVVSSYNPLPDGWVGWYDSNVV